MSEGYPQEDVPDQRPAMRVTARSLQAEVEAGLTLVTAIILERPPAGVTVMTVKMQTAGLQTSAGIVYHHGARSLIPATETAVAAARAGSRQHGCCEGMKILLDIPGRVS